MAERLVVLLVALVVAAGCGGGDDGGGGPAATPSPTAKPVGPESQGSVVQYADCKDWNRGTRAEKQATVVVLRGQLTPQSSETAESPLADERALEILDKACAPSFSKSLRLYKLYARAQAFAPLATD